MTLNKNLPISCRWSASFFRKQNRFASNSQAKQMLGFFLITQPVDTPTICYHPSSAQP